MKIILTIFALTMFFAALRGYVIQGNETGAVVVAVLIYFVGYLYGYGVGEDRSVPPESKSQSN